MQKIIDKNKSFICYSVSVIVVGFILLLCTAPNMASAQIVTDSSSSATTGSTALKTLTWQHTTNGSERILIVGVSLNANTIVSGITYAGLPLTKIVAYENGNANRVSLWYRLAPPTGTANVSVTVSATSARFVAGATTYTGINQSTPFGLPVTSRGSGNTTGSIDVSSAVNELVVGTIARRGDLTTNPIIVGSSQTPRWNTRTTLNNANTGITGGGSSKAGASTVTMSWSWPASRAWSMAGISLKPSISPQDTTAPLRSNGLPSGILPSGTSQTNMSVQTDENAVCKYSNNAGTVYPQMLNTFASTGSTYHWQQITGLADGANYAYYIRCADTLNNQNTDDFLISFSVDAPPPQPVDTEPPTVPSNFTAIPLTFSQINLSWDASTDNVGVAGYRLYRDNVLIGDTSENSFHDIGLQSETDYSYEVLAYDEQNNQSLKSEPILVSTLSQPVEPDTEAPSQPTNLTAIAISTSQINLSWDASTDNVGVAGYNVFRDGVNIAGVINETFIDSGLDDNTSYSYTVSAFDGLANQSGPSDGASAKTFAITPPPDVTEPLRFNALPSGTLESSTESTVMSIETDENAVCKLSLIDGSFDEMPDFFSATNGTHHEHLIVGLSEGMDYTYYVRCNDAFNNANTDSTIISFATAPYIDTQPPSAPQNLTIINVSPSSVGFAWLDAQDNVGVAGYKIFRDNELIAITTDNNYTDFGLSELTTYAYTVVAYDAMFNESDMADTLTVVTLQNDTLAPVIFGISVNQITTSSADISWQTDEPATSRVEYGLSGAYGAEIFDTNLKPEHMLSLTELSGGTVYHYRVYSTDGSGNTGVSSDQTFATLYALDVIAPSAVVDLAVTEVGQTYVGLTWTAPGDDSDNANVGQVKSYDIRYGTSSITELNWDSALQLTGEATPALAGNTQYYLAIGLKPGVSYYFAMRSYDEADNVSALSNTILVTTLAITQSNGVAVLTGGGGGGVSLIDITPPARPSEFQLLSFINSVLLRWKNPEDPDFVRVIIVKKEGSAPASITDGAVVYEGNDETFTDTNVIDGSSYFYGIFAYDRNLNYSPVNSIQTGEPSDPSQQIVLSESKEEQEPHVDSEIDGEYDIAIEFSDFATSDTSKLISVVANKFTRPLFFGLEGDDVAWLQTILARNKKMYPQGLVTGFFGNLTKSAVQKFQCAYGVVCSGNEQATGYGRIGNITIGVLSKLLSQDLNFVPKDRFISPILVYGMRDESVTKIQQFFAKDTGLYPYEFVTGYFGENTRNAVKKFQCLHNIVCEGNEVTTGYGQVGPKTALKINAIYSLW